MISNKIFVFKVLLNFKLNKLIELMFNVNILVAHNITDPYIDA